MIVYNLKKKTANQLEVILDPSKKVRQDITGGKVFLAVLPRKKGCLSELHLRLGAL